MDSEGMGREEVCSTISSLPGQLAHEDVEDFFSLAHYYATRTPQSFRKVLHLMLVCHEMCITCHVSRARTTTACCLAVGAVGPRWPPTSPTPSVCPSVCRKCSTPTSPTATLRYPPTTPVLCVCVGPAAVCLPGVQGSMKYFLVDCRPVDHFSCGHLPKSFHLDANLVHSTSPLPVIVTPTAVKHVL